MLDRWMALLYRIFPAHKYIALCVAAWGFIASLQSISNSLLAMLFLRALLGISEAAFGPGVPFYMSFFFKRNELALRTGLFISAAPLATSFASVLAWAITKVGEHSPIDSWRLLFLIEGFPSVVIAVFAWYHIPDSPETANFFNAREREVARLRLEGVHEAPALKSSGRGLMWIEIWQALKDPKSYLTAVSP
jgi:MFS family permease